MPQLWTETFVTQYFWLLAILFTFYAFIATTVIPKLANNIKARNISEESKEEVAQEVNTQSTTELYTQLKQNISIKEEANTWAIVQSEWLDTNPEEKEEFWASAKITEETEDYLAVSEEQEQSLEDFIKE